jgi:hypothetical protein
MFCLGPVAPFVRGSDAARRRRHCAQRSAAFFSFGRPSTRDSTAAMLLNVVIIQGFWSLKVREVELRLNVFQQCSTLMC